MKRLNLSECRQFRKLDIFEFIIALAVGLLYFMVCSIDVAWYNGDEKIYNFIISTSNDGHK